MSAIVRYTETMSPKERVRRTFEFDKTDRVTIGYEANGAVHMRFSQALGIPDGNLELVYRALGVDYRGVAPAYIGPELFTAPEGRRVDPVEGFVMRWAANENGGYWDFCDFPLKDADDEDFEKYPLPSPDDFDYARAAEYAAAVGREYALYVGNPGEPDIINSNGRIMGMEDVLCHLMLGDEAALSFIGRRCKLFLKRMERTIEACRDYIDFVWLGEDLGTQIAPMISLELYRKEIKPLHKLFVDLAKSYDLPVLFHTCGSSSWVYEDFIELGVLGVDTLQPEAVNMSPEYLVSHFGGRLNFRGCISTAGPLAYGTPDDTEMVCRETLDIMMPTRGYHFAPTHAIQDNTPVENIIAMYNAAHKYGRY